METILNKNIFFHTDNFPIVVEARSPQLKFEAHSHNFSELVIITNGTAIHSIDNRKYPISVGDVFIINANKTHEYLELNKLTLINILYDPIDLDLINWDIKELPGFRALFSLEPAYRQSHKFESKLKLFGAELRKTVNFTIQLEQELKNREAGFKVFSKAIFMQLLTHLARCYNTIKTPESIALLRIASAINYLEQNFTNDINFIKLAEIAFLSQRQFQRIFLKCMGKTALEYTTHLRLNFASSMLLTTEISISNIALDAGFKDSNYFTKVFKKYKGITPKNYRVHNINKN